MQLKHCKGLCTVSRKQKRAHRLVLYQIRRIQTVSPCANAHVNAGTSRSKLPGLEHDHPKQHPRISGHEREKMQTLRNPRIHSQGQGGGSSVAAGKSAASSLYPRSLSSSRPIFYPKRMPWHRWCRRSTASSSVFPDFRLLLTCPYSRIQRFFMLLAVANSFSLFSLFSCSFATQIHVLILILQTFRTSAMMRVTQITFR